MKKLVPFLCLVALVSSLGCGVSDPVLIENDPDLASLKGQSRLKAWALRVLQPDTHARSELPEGGFELVLDAGALQSETISCLKISGLFPSVEAEARVGRGEGAREPAFPLDLRIEVLEARGESRGKNGNYIPNLAFWWLISPLAASYVADEDFSAFLRVRASLFDPADPSSKEAVWQTELDADVTGSLDHFQRGFTVWDLLPTGPLTATVDPGCVSEVLVPHVWRKIEIALIRKLAAELTAPEVDVMVAIHGEQEAGQVAGVDPAAQEPGEESAEGKGESGKTKRHFFEADAGAAAAAFETSLGKKVVLIVSGSEMSDRLAGLAKTGSFRIRDLVVFYSGSGTLVSGKEGEGLPAIVPGAGEAPVPVADLLSQIAAIPAGSRVLILDTGFHGAGGRAVQVEGSAETAGIPAFPGMEKGMCLISACGPGQAGFDFLEKGHGALSAFLPFMFAKKSDRDGDGQVTASEIAAQLTWNIPRRVRLAGGAPQTPQVIGDAPLWRCPVRPEDPEEPEEPDAK